MNLIIFNSLAFRNFCILIICSLLFGCSFSANRASYIHKSQPGRNISFVPHDINLPGDKVIIPFKLVGDIPIIETYVNGQGPYNFVLDTGSTGLMLSPELVSQINPPVVRVEAVLHMRGGERNLGYMRHISLIELGGAKFYEIDASVVSSSNISKALGKVDGILGLQVFARCLLTIDYLNHRIMLETSILSAERGNTLPLKPLSGGVVAVQISVNEKDLWCMIDSGSTYGIVTPYRMATILPLAKKPVWVPRSSLMFYGKLPNRKARLKNSVAIGRHELINPIISFQGNINLIGYEILKHFIVTVDQKAMLARFVRYASGPIDPPPPIRHHGFRFIRKGDFWEVRGSFEGLNLEKIGLLWYDRIKQINKKPVSQITDSQLQEMVRENDKLSLEVTREGKSLSLEVPVTTLIQ